MKTLREMQVEWGKLTYGYLNKADIKLGQTYWTCHFETASGKGEKINSNLLPTSFKYTKQETHPSASIDFLSGVEIIEGNKKDIKRIPQVMWIQDRGTARIFLTREECVNYYNLSIEIEALQMQQNVDRMTQTINYYRSFAFVDGKAPETSSKSTKTAKVDKI